MAVLLRNKSTIYGLNTDLSNLTAADAAEALRAAAAEEANAAAVALEQGTRTSEDARIEAVVASNKGLSEAADSTLQGNIDTLSSTIDSNKSASDAATALVQTNLDSEIGSTNTDVTNLNARVDDVLSNIDATSLDSLTEVVGAFQAADSDLNQAITDLAAARQTAMTAHIAEALTKNNAQDAEDVRIEGKLDSAVATLTASNSTEKARAEAAEALKLAIASNLSDLADKGVSRTNLDVYSKAEVDSGIGSGGAVFKTETLTVSADGITLGFAPKNGVLFNFSTVRHIDANGVAYDIEVSPVVGQPKQFTVNGDSAGQFDGKSVVVQYAYST